MLIDLLKAEISLLLKCLNLSLPQKKLKFQNHLLPFELLYREVLHDESNINESIIHLKSKIKDAGLSFFRLYNKTDHRFENVSAEEYEAFINLQSNKNIITQKADKDNSVGVIHCLSYVKKYRSY